jgi:hypothetical protein
LETYWNLLTYWMDRFHDRDTRGPERKEKRW